MMLATHVVLVVSGDYHVTRAHRGDLGGVCGEKLGGALASGYDTIKTNLLLIISTSVVYC